jgi:hypothetical protein
MTGREHAEHEHVRAELKRPRFAIDGKRHAPAIVPRFGEPLCAFDIARQMENDCIDQAK